MALSGEQKNFIKKYIWKYSPAEIAGHLGLPESEIHSYLKKRWRPEKYQKYLNRFRESVKYAGKNFSFKNFLLENRAVLIILVALVTIAYFNTLHNTFVSDDIPSISQNPSIGNFGNFLFTTPFGFIQRLIYWLAFKGGGLSPVLYHLPNIFFHLGTTLLAFFILSLLAPRPWAVMASMLFAVHPILSESVTWISGSIYVQSAFFFLLSLAFYILSDQKPRFYYYSIAAFALSIDSSEKAVVLCAIFAAYEIAFGNLRENWKKLWPFFAISFAMGLFLLSKVGMRESVLKTSYYLTPGRDSLFIKIPTSVYSYFRIIFWPDKLSLYQTEMVFTKLQYGGTIVVFLLYLGLIIYTYLKNKPLSFWLVFFIVPLATTLTPMRIAWAVAERYAYLSTLGILVVVAWLFYKASGYEKFRYAVYAVFSIIIIALSVRTIVRNMDWRNEETLWTATEKTSPSGPNIHNNMGAVYQKKGEIQKAIDEFQLAISINPAYADAYHNLANTYQQAGRPSEAIEYFKKAIDLNPQLWQSHQNLASIYYKQGNYAQAGEEIKKALEINPGDPNLKQNLGLIEDGLKNAGQTAPAADAMPSR